MTTKIPVELSSTPGIVDGSNATAITIDSSERVGIGTASPAYLLHLQASTDTDLNIISGTSSGDFGSILFGDTDYPAEGRITYQNSDNAMRFWTNRSQAMMINSSGNVGIGTTNPAEKLSINNASGNAYLQCISGNGNLGGVWVGDQADNYVGAFLYDNATDTSLFWTNNAERMRITSAGHVTVGSGDNVGTAGSITMNVGTTSSSGGIQLFAPTDVAHGINFGDAYSTSAVYAGAIEYNHASNYMRFFTAATEKLRILSTGLFAIGTTVNTVAKMHIVESESRDCLRLTNTRNPSSSAPYVATFGFNYQPNNGTSTFLACQDDLDGSPTNRCIIQSNGGIANYQSNNSNLSDARLKTDIQNAPNALDIINNLKVRTFKYHDQTDEKIHTGLIAQEAETVDLSLVNQDGWADKAPDGEEPYKSIYSTDLMFKMLKAIQEQQEQIEQLKTEIQTLKGE